MTTGAPIYLVSACTSGEEFISAFRRYADRNGVIFIPIAEPLPAGRKGRFALALTGGGVMIEGQAEVVSSARTPSVLYGRIGMTMKFLAPDEPSKTILGELEKARTSLKPPAPSVPPRPAEIPAEPRPTPPAPSGRIDAVNALAECVVIGDVSTLSRDSDLGTIPPPIGDRTLGAATAPVPVIATTTPSSPAPRAPAGAVPIAAPKTGSAPVAKPPTMPAATMPPPFKPAIPERPKSASLPPAVPPLPPSLGTRHPLTATSLGMAPIRSAATTTPAPNAPPPPLPAKPLGIAPPPPIAASPPPPAVAPAVPATREEAVAAALKFAQAVEARGAALPDETVKGLPPGFVSTETIRGTLPASALAPAPPPPIQYPNAEESDEKTDLTSIPMALEPPRSRTEIGVAVTPSGALVLPSAPAMRAPTDDEMRATTEMAAIDPTNPLDVGLTPVEQVDPLGSTQAAIRLSKLQPTIEEPSGDWTMSTNDGSLTITPRKVATPAPADVPAVPKGPPTGDYIIALDPSRPDGWSEPSKVEKRPEGELPPGPPVSAVSSDKPLDSDARAQPDVATDEPKIQIDPTLIEPLTPMPVLTDADDVIEPPPVMPPPPSTSTPMTPMLPLVAPPPSQQMMAQPGAVPIVALPFVTPPVAPQLASASGSSPAIPFDAPPLASEMSRAAHKRRRRLIIIVASVIAVIILAVIIVVMASGRSAPATGAVNEQRPAKTLAATPVPAEPQRPTQVAAPQPPRPAQAVQAADQPPPSDDEIEVETRPAVQAEPAPPAQEMPASTECTLTIQSVPPEAEVSIDTVVKGPAPVTATLPCGVAVKVTLKKQRYQTMTRDVTPKANARPLKIALARTTFTVKVSSSPPGATVTLGGKTLGLTPTTVKVPAFEASTLKIAKDGYAPELQKVTPKNNASSLTVTLKKNPAKGSPIKKLN